jgi:hemerythrin-like metal-binding protein
MTPTELLAEIYRDHEELTGVVDALRGALETRDYADARSLLVRLQAIEIRHYATEDALMRAVAFDHAETHRTEHAALLDMLDRINRTLALENPGAISPKIVAHLEAALGHMMNADDKLNRFVVTRFVQS